MGEGNAPIMLWMIVLMLWGAMCGAENRDEIYEKEHQQLQNRIEILEQEIEHERAKHSS